MLPSLYLHVNQQRQAFNPSQCLCPPVSTTCAALVIGFFSARDMIYVRKQDILHLTSTFPRGYVKPVSCLAQATFQESFFFFTTFIERAINIIATRPSRGYKAYLQLSWIISKS